MQRRHLVNIPPMTVETARETKSRRLVTLPARPEPIRVAAEETAVIVVDMQNAYASEGGYLDLAGFDIGGAGKVIGQTAKVVETARAAGLPVIYFQNGWDEDYVEAGGPGSPNWHKSNALKTMRPSATESAGLSSVMPLAPVRKLVNCACCVPVTSVR